jgi:hypothetical protein
VTDPVLQELVLTCEWIHIRNDPKLNEEINKYINIFLYVLYRVVVWNLALRGGRRQKRGCRTLYNKEQHSSQFIAVIKSRWIRKAASVLHIQGKRKTCRVLMGNLKERSYLENIDIDGRMSTVFV